MTDNRINTLGYVHKADEFPMTQDEMRAALEADPETMRLISAAFQLRYEALTTNDPSTYELYTTYRTLYEFARSRACRTWAELAEREGSDNTMSGSLEAAGFGCFGPM